MPLLCLYYFNFQFSSSNLYLWLDYVMRNICTIHPQQLRWLSCAVNTTYKFTFPKLLLLTSSAWRMVFCCNIWPSLMAASSVNPQPARISSSRCSLFSRAEHSSITPWLPMAFNRRSSDSNGEHACVRAEARPLAPAVPNNTRSSMRYTHTYRTTEGRVCTYKLTSVTLCKPLHR